MARPPQEASERKFDVNSTLGDLQAKLSREVLKQSTTIRVTAENKSRLLDLLNSRDEANIPEMVAILNSDANFAAARNGAEISADDVVQRLAKQKWAVHSQEKQVLPSTEVQERPPAPPEMPQAPQPPIEDAIQRMLQGIEQTTQESEQPVVLDMDNLPGLESLAAIAREAQVTVQPATLPEEIIVSTVESVEVPVELPPTPVATKKVEPIRVEPIRVEEPTAVERPREEVAPAGRSLDFIPIYGPDANLAQKLLKPDINKPTVKEFGPGDLLKGREFRRLVGEFRAGRKDMIAVLAEFDLLSDTFTETTEPTQINATTPFYEWVADNYPLLNPMNSARVFQERQADGWPNYAVMLGDLGDNKRHFIVYRFIDHATQVGMQYQEVFQEDPLEFLVQSVMEAGDVLSLLGAHQQLEAAKADGDADAIVVAEAQLQKAQAVFTFADIEKRAFATKDILEHVGQSQEILAAAVAEKRRIDQIFRDYQKTNVVGGSLPRPMDVYDTLARHGVDVSGSRPKPTLAAGRYEKELVGRDLTQNEVVLAAVTDQVKTLIGLLIRFAPAGEQITHKGYAQDLETLQSFLDNPTYEALAAAEAVARSWQAQVREQYEKYYLAIGQAARFEGYRKKLGLIRLDEAEIESVDAALEQIEYGLFEIFEDQILQKLVNKDPNQRKGAFDAFTNWVEQQAIVSTTAEAGVELVFGYIQEAVILAAEEYEAYLQAIRDMREDANKHRDNFNRMQEQGLLPDLKRLKPEQRRLFTTAWEDLTVAEQEEHDEILRESVLKQLMDSKVTASRLMRGLQNWLNANTKTLVELEEPEDQAQRRIEIEEVAKMLGRVSPEDPNKRVRDASGDNTLFYMMQAHEKVAQAANDGRMTMKGDKNQNLRALRTALAEILPLLTEVADYRDGRDEKTTVEMVGTTARVLNQEIDKTKQSVQAAVTAALS